MLTRAVQLLRYASFLSKSLTIDSVGLRKAVKKCPMRRWRRKSIRWWKRRSKRKRRKWKKNIRWKEMRRKSRRKRMRKSRPIRRRNRRKRIKRATKN